MAVKTLQEQCKQEPVRAKTRRPGRAKYIINFNTEDWKYGKRVQYKIGSTASVYS